jgi:small subunit ribosomal protein S21
MVEITVNQNLEKAMRVLKRKLIREGIFKELKARRFYEKPCEKRIRKEKESYKKKRRDNGVFTITPIKKVC